MGDGSNYHDGIYVRMANKCSKYKLNPKLLKEVQEQVLDEIKMFKELEPIK
jgi:hypothetical protein